MKWKADVRYVGGKNDAREGVKGIVVSAISHATAYIAASKWMLDSKLKGCVLSTEKGKDSLELTKA